MSAYLVHSLSNHSFQRTQRQLCQWVTLWPDALGSGRNDGDKQILGNAEGKPEGKSRVSAHSPLVSAPEEAFLQKLLTAGGKKPSMSPSLVIEGSFKELWSQMRVYQAGVITADLVTGQVTCLLATEPQ